MDTPYSSALDDGDGITQKSVEVVEKEQNDRQIAFRTRRTSGKASLWRPQKVYRKTIKTALKKLDNIIQVMSKHSGLKHWQKCDSLLWQKPTRWPDRFVSIAYHYESNVVHRGYVQLRYGRHPERDHIYISFHDIPRTRGHIEIT